MLSKQSCITSEESNFPEIFVETKRREMNYLVIEPQWVKQVMLDKGLQTEMCRFCKLQMSNAYGKHNYSNKCKDIYTCCTGPSKQICVTSAEKFATIGNVLSTVCGFKQLMVNMVSSIQHFCVLPWPNSLFLSTLFLQQYSRDPLLLMHCMKGSLAFKPSHIVTLLLMTDFHSFVAIS